MNAIVRTITLCLCILLSVDAYGVEPGYTPVAQKRAPAKKKQKKTPIKSVSPSIDKNFTPQLFSSIPMRFAIAAYKECMYGENDSAEERLDRALRLNLEYRNEKSLKGTMEKLGREVCLAEALGLGRFETQADIDRARGTELVEINSPYVLMPDDQIPLNRRFARPWVKDYVEGLGRDLNLFLAQRHRDDIEEAREQGRSFPLEQLRVNSLVRAIEDQNEQASPAKCKNEICSTHLTGSTVDLSNNSARVSGEVRDWLMKRLIEDRKAGKIIMIQEFKRPHFHLLVIPPEYLQRIWE